MNKIKLISLALTLLIVGVLLALIFFSDDFGNSCDIKDYTIVKINTQTWMAENLNCNIRGSKCYDNDAANCTKYGRLYNWAAAMALPFGCNSTSCANLVSTPHRGICPKGWHIPNNAEWNALSRFVDGVNDESVLYDSPTAGKYLKTTNDWINGGNGEDTHGFSALPSGSGYPDGNFEYIGGGACWWSANEDLSDNAFSRGLTHKSGYAGWLNYGKDHLFSVRCVQD